MKRSSLVNNLQQIVGALLAMVGAVFVGAGTNDAGSESNDAVFVGVGIALIAVGAALCIWLWRSGVFDETPPRAVLGAALAISGAVMSIALADVWGPAPWVALVLAVIGLILMMKTGASGDKATQPV